MASFSTRVRRRLRPSVVVDVVMDVGWESRCRIHICSPSVWFLVRSFPGQVPHRGGMTTDDLSRWELCGIPSTSWHSPTTRHPGGSPRRNRSVRCLALPPGCRVVAPWGRSRGCHTLPTQPSHSSARDRPSRRPARPARAWFGLGLRRAWRCSAIRHDLSHRSLGAPLPAQSVMTTTLTRTVTVAAGVFAPGHLGELTRYLLLRAR